MSIDALANLLGLTAEERRALRDLDTYLTGAPEVSSIAVSRIPSKVDLSSLLGKLQEAGLVKSSVQMPRPEKDFWAIKGLLAYVRNR
jgi:hypothetical protein